MESPILSLEKPIRAAPGSIAPERIAKCQELCDRHGITLRITDESGFNIRVELGENRIILPIPALEFLWAFTFNCWVLTQEYPLAQQLGESEFSLARSERMEKAHLLLCWAKKNLTANVKEPWPLDFPAPEISPPLNSDNEVANELFLCSIGWIMHHEIGHVVRGHSVVHSVLSIQEEQDADSYSTDWILGKLDPQSPFRLKRTIGIAVAILCLQSLEEDSNSCLRNTHPNAPERIYACLLKNNQTQGEYVKALMAVVLQYLYFDKGIEPDIDGETYGEILSDLLVKVSKS